MLTRVGLLCMYQLKPTTGSAPTPTAIRAVVLLGLTLRRRLAGVAPRKVVRATEDDGLRTLALALLRRAEVLEPTGERPRLLARALVGHGRHLFRGLCDDCALTNVIGRLSDLFKGNM